METQNISPRSRLVTVLLCWVLGWIGAHRFYVGKNESGVGMLITTIIGFFTSFFGVGFIFLAAVGIVVLVDLIKIITGSFTEQEGRRVYKWTEPGTT